MMVSEPIPVQAAVLQPSRTHSGLLPVAWRNHPGGRGPPKLRAISRGNPASAALPLCRSTPGLHLIPRGADCSIQPALTAPAIRGCLFPHRKHNPIVSFNILTVRS